MWHSDVAHAFSTDTVKFIDLQTLSEYRVSVMCSATAVIWQKQMLFFFILCDKQEMLTWLFFQNRWLSLWLWWQKEHKIIPAVSIYLSMWVLDLSISIKKLWQMSTIGCRRGSPLTMYVFDTRLQNYSSEYIVWVRHLQDRRGHYSWWRFSLSKPMRLNGRHQKAAA